MPEEMLEDVDSMYGEEEEYDTRTEVVESSLDTLIERMEEKEVDQLYDAAFTSYLNALDRKRFDLAERARNHITENFSYTRLAEELEIDY